MDKVRFGRALGHGARQAARTLQDAAAAASAPDPRTPGSPSSAPQTSGRPAPATGAAPTAPAAAAPATKVSRLAGTRARDPQPAAGMASSARRSRLGGQAKQSFLEPLARFSSVVGLQVSGTFFTVLALLMGQAVWRERHVLLAGAGQPDARHLYLVSFAFILFTYFAISSFWRARRRDRS